MTATQQAAVDAIRIIRALTVDDTVTRGGQRQGPTTQEVEHVVAAILREHGLRERTITTTTIEAA